MSTRAELAREIGTRISTWQDATQRFEELAAAQMGLYVTDLRIVATLGMRGAMPAGHVAAAAGLSPGAATTAIDRLEVAEYVERRRGQADRRVVTVGLTARARRLIRRIWGPLVEEGTAKLLGYSLAELELLRDFVGWCLELQERHNARVGREGGAGGG